jgi:hypothetical protein
MTNQPLSRQELEHINAYWRAANYLSVPAEIASPQGINKSEDIVILPLVNKLSKEFFEIIFTKSQSCDDMIKFI